MSQHQAAVGSTLSSRLKQVCYGRVVRTLEGVPPREELVEIEATNPCWEGCNEMTAAVSIVSSACGMDDDAEFTFSGLYELFDEGSVVHWTIVY